MTVVSFSINESLKKFINKLVSNNKYDNKSKLIRDALLRLMKSEEVTEEFPSSSNVVFPIRKQVTGNLIIVIPQDPGVQRKLNKIESEFRNQIMSKNQHFTGENISIFIVFEGDLQEFHEFVVEINGISELENFRYLIIKIGRAHV